MFLRRPIDLFRVQHWQVGFSRLVRRLLDGLALVELGLSQKLHIGLSHEPSSCFVALQVFRNVLLVGLELVPTDNSNIALKEFLGEHEQGAVGRFTANGVVAGRLVSEQEVAEKLSSWKRHQFHN